MAGWICECSGHGLIGDSQPRKIAKRFFPYIEEHSMRFTHFPLFPKNGAGFLARVPPNENTAPFDVCLSGFLSFLKSVVKSFFSASLVGNRKLAKRVVNPDPATSTRCGWLSEMDSPETHFRMRRLRRAYLCELERSGCYKSSVWLAFRCVYGRMSAS